jgi:hypothetical protein
MPPINPKTSNDINEPIAQGQINLKFQLSRKTIVILLGAMSTFASGVAAGSIYANPPIRNSEVSPAQIELCVREENGEILCEPRQKPLN